MSVRQIWITTFDLERLSSLIDGVRATGSQKKAYLDQLEKELERAKVVAPEKIPEDVITMNSAVSVRDLESGEETTYTLVFPGEGVGIIHEQDGVLFHAAP